MPFRKDIFISLLIFTLPAIFAFTFHDKAKAIVNKPESSPYLRTVEALKGQNVLWLDARSEKKYALKHIPGAILVNFNDWEGSLGRLFEAFDTFDPDGTIVVYCNIGCSSSNSVASRLRQELAKENVYFLKGGMPAWFDAQ